MRNYFFVNRFSWDRSITLLYISVAICDLISALSCRLREVCRVERATCAASSLSEESSPRATRRGAFNALGEQNGATWPITWRAAPRALRSTPLRSVIQSRSCSPCSRDAYLVPSAYVRLASRRARRLWSARRLWPASAREWHPRRDECFWSMLEAGACAILGTSVAARILRGCLSRSRPRTLLRAMRPFVRQAWYRKRARCSVTTLWRRALTRRTTLL